MAGFIKKTKKYFSNETSTDEFSFILHVSHIADAGIGVFATHDIAKGTFLRLFGDQQMYEDRIRVLNMNEVPQPFRDYCMNREDCLVCPEDFGQMPVGWYLNHSKNANAVHKNFDWYAARDIKKGEEITIDYNSLMEPESAKESYY